MRKEAKFEDHYRYTDLTRRPLLKIIQRLMMWDADGMHESITASQRIAYNKRNGIIFLEVKVQRKALVLHLIDVPDPQHLLSKIPATHKWRQLSRKAKVESVEDLAALLPIIHDAWMRA